MAEQDLQQMANQPVPRRRFGSRVTAQQQQQVIQQQQEAREELRKIQEENERIARERAAAEAVAANAAAQRREAEQKYKDYIVARKVAHSGKLIPMNKAQREIYNDIRAGINNLEKYKAAIANAKAQQQFVESQVAKGQYYSPANQSVVQQYYTSAPAQAQVQGPVRPNVNVVEFRRTGITQEVYTPTNQPQYTSYDIPKKSSRPQGLPTVRQVNARVKEYIERVETQTPEYIARNPDKFERVARLAGSGAAQLSRQALDKYSEYRERFQDKPTLLIGNARYRVDLSQSRYATVRVVGSVGRFSRGIVFDAGAFVALGSIQAGLWAAATVQTLGGLNRVFNSQIIETKREILNPDQSITEITERKGGGAVQGLSEIVGGIFLSASELNAFLKKPVVLGYVTPKEGATTGSITKVLARGDKEDIISTFFVGRARSMGGRIETTRLRYSLDILKRPDLGESSLVDIQKLNPKEILENFPSAKFIETSRAEVTVGLLEPTLFNRKGKPLYRIRDGKLPQITTFRQSSGRLRTRNELYLSSSDIVESQKNIRSLVDKAILQKLVTKAELMAGSEFKKGDFIVRAMRDISIVNKQLKDEILSFGVIGTIDPLKAKIGRATRRTRVGSTSNIISTINYAREFGLVEQNILKEKIAAVDVTYPRFKRPKRVEVVSGKGIIEYYNLPSLETEPVGKLIKMGNTKPRTPLSATFQKQILQQQEVVKAMQGAALKSTRLSRVNARAQLNELNRINSLPTIVGGAGQQASQYSGKGMYDIVESTSNKVRNDFTTLQNNIQIQFQPLSFKNAQRFRLESSQRTQQREVLRNPTREVQTDINKNILREETILRAAQRTQQRTIQRTVLRNPQRSQPPTLPRLIRGPPSSKTRFRFRLGFGITPPKPLGLEAGFKTFLFRRGKKEYLGGTRTREQALLAGELAVTKGISPLSARFGIERAGIVKGIADNEKAINEKIFREFKIRQGKNIKTPNVFIQRRQYRLSNLAERIAIQKARRSRAPR